MSNVSEKLRLAREKSKKRKFYLFHTLGSSWAEELGCESKQSKKSTTSTDNSSRDEDHVQQAEKPYETQSFPAEKDAKLESSDNDHSSKNRTEEFRDSTAFLKGTQSLNPHNDYSQNFVDTGHRPQNFIRMSTS